MSFSYFSSDLNQSALVFELVAGVSLLLIFIYGFRNYRFFLWRFFALAFGVFCFEGLTGALWDNSHLGKYAYIHNDVSWVMTLAWAGIIFFVRFVYDKFCQKKTLKQEFLSIVLASSIISGTLLFILSSIDVFSYSSTTKSIIGSSILIFGIPLEAIIYLPVFIFTSYSFYKYWELAMYDKKLFLNYRISLKKDFILSFFVLVLLGYLMHPLLDMTFFGGIILIIGYLIILFLTSIITSIVKDTPLVQRFLGAIFLFSLASTFYTDILARYGVIRISQAIKNTYTVNTITIPYMTITDVEFVGIVLLSFLMVAMIQYFKIITDNMFMHIDEKNMTFQGYRSLYSNTK